MSEDAIVEWFSGQSKLSEADFPIGIGDDMAEVRLGPSSSVLITTDILADGVHFDLEKATLQQVGFKAMAVSVSDCAAMATIPVAAVVSVVLPERFGEEELKQLHTGIISAGERFGCELIGGDIASWKSGRPFVINVAMLSRPAATSPIRRSGAKPGDCICVTGQLGGAGRGRHLDVEPRFKEAIQITSLVSVNSMIDISDGLSSDLNRICRQSGVGAIIDVNRIPISAQAQQKEDPLSSALNDGEDFELLFTLSNQECRKLLEQWREQTAITRIGKVTDTGIMQMRQPCGRICEFQASGYDHLL